MSKYGVFPGPYFCIQIKNWDPLSVFSPNLGKYRPEKTPYVSTFHAMFHKYLLKPLNSGHLQVFKSLSVIERCPLLGGNLKRLSYLGLKVLSAVHGMSAIWDVRYWEVSQ